MKWYFKTSFVTRNNWGIWLLLISDNWYVSAFYKAEIMKQFTTILGFALLSWSGQAMAEQCLLPKEHLRSVDCQIEAGAMSRDWGSLVIRYENERVHFFQTNATTFLMNQREVQRLAQPTTAYDNHASWGEAEGYDLNALKHPSKNQAEAAWACYAQTTGDTAICIPY